MWSSCSSTMVRMGVGTFTKPCSLLRPVKRLSGRFLTHQSGLPSLPVPALQQTCERYLSVLEPIVEAEELRRTRELLDAFVKPGGVGERLQAGLEQRATRTENWLSDWWVNVAYLDYRLPVVVHSSPGLVLPSMNFNSREGQMRFAAKLISGVLDFKTMIDNESLPVEYLGNQPLCMSQYYEVLSSCRVPGLKRDSIVNHGRSSKPPRHITVAFNFQFFKLDVYDDDWTPLTTEQIFVQLQRICSGPDQTRPEPVGILTTQHRDSWAKTYLSLTKDKTNKESVLQIQRSIFMLCLDGSGPQESEDLGLSPAAEQMLHGGGSRGNSGNRWFDKTLQFIVAEDGTCGVNYEHSPAEGPPIVALIDHVVQYTCRPEVKRTPMMHLSPPQKLEFKVTPEIRRDIEEAKQSIDRLADDLELKVTVFTHFGKNVPKAHKMSPDAFIQMSLQLAFYRTYRRCCATYESASLRMFRLGRTDTIRSASTASAAFVKSFDDAAVQNTEKKELLLRAVNAHKSYTNMAITGQAVDRHLLGLKLQALEQKLPVPDVFSDPVHAKALHYQLSTSQVPSKSGCILCFGPVVSNGYGFCYNPMENLINFTVSAFNSCGDTSAARLSASVEEALLDMRDLLETTPRSKL